MYYNGAEDIFAVLCDKCKRHVAMTAFSEGSCESCGEPIYSVCTPCDKLCLRCAEIERRCIHCGKPLEDKA